MRVNKLGRIPFFALAVAGSLQQRAIASVEHLDRGAQFQRGPAAAPVKSLSQLAQMIPSPRTGDATPPGDEESRHDLLNALHDPRKEIRSDAARVLASSSDRTALSAIERGIDSGLFSDVEAVNYFGLADIRVGGAYLLRQLGRASPNAKVLAVQLLGAHPDYQLAIREKVFFNPAADPTVRAVAATVLSQHDPKFVKYALLVTLDPKIPAQVFANTVKGYVSQTMAAGKLDANERFLVRDAIHNYQKNSTDVQSLKALREALQIMGF
jgi:hypothetical protein